MDHQSYPSLRFNSAAMFDVARLRDPSRLPDRSAPWENVLRQLSTTRFYFERQNLAFTPSLGFQSCQTLRETPALCSSLEQNLLCRNTLPSTFSVTSPNSVLNLSATSSNEKTRSTNVTIHNCEGELGEARAAAAMRVKVEAPT
ncbi:methyltransferase type 12 [Colletotrichum scovillei]|uniref:Methyltransferase type 12 n=1 Tax=Colletotrichum scovillei TaxID=1209932 RepID=A0A9P7QTX1_9PEZI|nr:methyltransferase type 12 [Colletotrichum scovillei]KAG7041377.1 methyltransferase type 12 [Colletotrichum scovillei]KAG7061404.1 methyltransferase type 12 [Colletotrichum scovillei]